MNPPPDTLFVITSLHGGGAERLLTNLLLRESPARTMIVTMMPGGVFRTPLEDAGFRVIDLRMRRFRYFVPGVLRLARILRREPPKVVFGWMYGANLVAAAARLFARAPRPRLFWGVFNTDLAVGPFDWKMRLVEKTSVFLSRWVRGVVYNADEARDYHHEIGFREEHSLVIPNCVDRDVFAHDPQHRGSVREELGIGPDDVIVAVAARVDPMKDWGMVREAVRDLPGVVTVAVGKGTDELPPQRGFIGLGWRDDVARILSAADVFLLGSAFGEGASLAVNEAMHCGLPCIVTNVGGNAALVGGGGIVVPPRDPAAIREAIVALARDRARREQLGLIARARAESLQPRQEVVLRLRRLTLETEDAS